MEMVVMKIIFSVCLVFISSLLFHLYNVVWLKPERLRSKLRKQGIYGPPPSFPYGNLPDIKRIQSTAAKNRKHEKSPIIHDFSSILYPHLMQWRKQYGKVFTFSMGNEQILCLTHPDVVKDMILNTSLDLGKPSYQQKELGSLLGKGILTSNGATWVHHRKVIAPELYLEKVKGMINQMVEATNILVNSWDSKIESKVGFVDLRIDEDLKRFSSFAISKTIFGRDYEMGLEVILRLIAIQKAIVKPTMIGGILGLRNLPTKNNQKLWRLEKEVHSMIMKVVKGRADSTSDKDILQMIIEGAKIGNLGEDAVEEFIVHNCKNIFLAAFETTAITTSWALILLASYPDWQDRVRAEVVQICGGHIPDVQMIKEMKLLTMVLQETLRLYSPAKLISREVLKDVKLGNMLFPKGVNVWIPMIPLHQDADIWGPDSHNFNPDRFANGLNSACKFPQAYLPFGIGARTCVGQHFAMFELKVALALILSKFSVSLSPSYRHSPNPVLIVGPQFGANLIIKRL